MLQIGRKKVAQQKYNYLTNQLPKYLNSVPKVSIIMNCFNGSKYLRESIDSVYAQTYRNWEIIFWDNASTDNSAEIAKNYDNRLRYFRSERNYPLVGKVRNLAYKQANGEYIALLDVDDIWFPEKLERQLSLFEKNMNIALVFSNVIVFYENGVEYELYKYVKPKRGYVFGELVRNNFISTVSMMYRRSALECLDYIFDDEFTFIQDYDLSLRIAYKYEIDYIDEPLAKLRKHSDNLGDKLLFLLPQENLKLLEKTILSINDIKDKFSEDIRYFKKQTDLFSAYAEWKKGNKRLSLKYLSPYLSDKKYLLIFLCICLFSYSQYESLKSKIKQMIKIIK